MAGFYASAGRMHVKNDAGETVFDTDEGLFAVTDYVAGSLTLSSRSASYDGAANANYPVDVATDHAVASINSAADTVRGAFSVTVPAGGGADGYVTGLGYFNASGTYLHYYGCNGYYGHTATDNDWVADLAGYTFIAGGGSLILRERVVLQAWLSLGTLTYTTTLKAPTFTYKLFCGAFV